MEDTSDFKTRAVKVFKDCSQVPVASRARIFPSEGKRRGLEVTWSQKELERGKKISYSKSYFVEDGRDGGPVQPLCETPFQSKCSNVYVQFSLL